MTPLGKGNPQREKVILAVEDDPQNLKLIRDLLQASGYKTLEATDGKQAVELAKDNKPDLILMDIQMPDMNGLEAASILKKDAKTKSIPIIALTAFAMGGDEERILTAGCDGYIPKPIDIEVFLKKVSEHILCEEAKYE
ncbi:MAG: response regulator [Candidatus Latescibacteria bacterium]|nr:response regulator [Candidatus Latescibacterota bacterium]